MQPPQRINVIDRHNGFTAVTTKRGDTLWRTAPVLRDHPPIGQLVSYDEHSFYQNNNNVTEALYKVTGYRFLVVLWFDNQSGRRIA